MLEINQETSSTILYILDVLKKVASSDYNLKIPFSLLSPNIFLNLKHEDIEKWAYAIISKLFEQTFISENHSKISGDEVADILKDKNEDLYEKEFLFAQHVYDNKLEEELTEYESYLGTEDEYIEMHFDNLEIGKITFKSYLFTSKFECDFYKKYLPLYVMSKYNLEYTTFIDADFDDDLNFTIWYLESEIGEFRNDIIYSYMSFIVYKFFADMFL